VLIGVNVGPNLTYVGSLANLLWRGVLRREMTAGPVEFSRLGMCTVPLALVLSVVGLWLSVNVFGG
jgi:arsenical pump membrane protein